MKRSRSIIAVAAALAAMFVFAGCDTGAGQASQSSAAESPAAASETASSEDVSQASESVPSAEPTEAADASAAGDSSQTGDTSAGDSTQVGDTSAASDSALPTPNPMYETLTVTGVIASVDHAMDIIYITPDGTDAATDDPSAQIGAVEADDCIMINVETGQEVDDDRLQAGDRVQAYVGVTMTRSIPPQAPCYALLTGIPADGQANASYVYALSVTQNADGSVTVLNQNTDIEVTIPADLTVEIFDERQTATLGDIRAGSHLIVWYDSVTRSYPGQATATRVMIDLDD